MAPTTLRAFVAIELAPSVRAELSAFVDELHRLELDASFVRPEAMHLTLQFLGEVERTRTAAIGEALVRAAADLAPFTLDARRLGSFGAAHAPSVVWMGLAASEPLLALQRAVQRELQGLGFEPEARAYHPHLTLARIKSPRNATRLRERIQASSLDECTSPIAVNGVHLFESQLGREGARYHKLASAPLLG